MYLKHSILYSVIKIHRVFSSLTSRPNDSTCSHRHGQVKRRRRRCSVFVPAFRPKSGERMGGILNSELYCPFKPLLIAGHVEGSDTWPERLRLCDAYQGDGVIVLRRDEWMKGSCGLMGEKPPPHHPNPPAPQQEPAAAEPGGVPPPLPPPPPAERLICFSCSECRRAHFSRAECGRRFGCHLPGLRF